jgi:hypothetical protein
MRIATAVGLCLAAAAAGAQSVVIRGTVRDSATGQAMTGAIVSVLSANKLVSVRTDEAGVFTISGVNAGATTLYSRRLGYAQGEWPINVTKDTTVSLLMRPTARMLAPVRVGAKGEGIWGVIGRVDDLQPVPDAKVFVIGSQVTVATDSAGEFFVPLKHPGTFMIRVTREGYAEELLPVIVKKDQVVESSELLERSDRKPLPMGLWTDLDFRLRWAPQASAFVTGAELREHGVTIRDALAASPAFVKKGLRFLPDTVCIYVNADPRPNMSINAVLVEHIRAIEVYSDTPREEMYHHLGANWPNLAPCSNGKPPNPAKKVTMSALPKEPPKVKWIVIWTR